MKVLVTGVSGFIGANVARRLLEHGYEVRALMRQDSNQRNLDGLKVERAYGDLKDRLSLWAALNDCEAVCHVAASYSMWTADPESVYETNVRGTQNLIEAAVAQGVKRIVYTSSESTVGVKKGCLSDEELYTDPTHSPGHYKRSKCLAERVVLEAGLKGAPVVVVNPTTPVGAYDIKPTPTGKVILDFLNRRMPGYVNTGLNIVDVEDVAEGHVLALEKGKVGERYVLGNRNMTLKELFETLFRITGVRAPALRVPLWSALMAGYADEFISWRILRREPRIPVAGVKAARKFRYFDCSKAIRELGLPQTPVEEALARAVKWFRDNDYVVS